MHAKPSEENGMYSQYGLLINNTWQTSSDQGTMAVFSPVSEDVIGHIPMATDDDIARALRSAASGFTTWREVPAWNRAKIMRKASDLIRERVEVIARMMSTETGKPLAEARGETNAAADQFEWYGEEAKRVYGQTIPGRAVDQRMTVLFQPVGVCLSLSAWNFPALLPARKIAAALAAGCSVIARPASEAPGTCFALVQCLVDAGITPGAVTVLTGPAKNLSEKLIASPIVRKVSLTGSVTVGKSILRQCADGMKRVSMELGGHAPVIVHHDADPVMAARATAAAKFRNCGQVCISPSRFYVHESIIEAFQNAFADFAKTLVVGDGLDEKTSMGPMIRARGLLGAEELIADALAKKAKLLTGGKRPAHLNKGHFLEPTVLSDVPDDARIMYEEPFAPIAPIIRFSNTNEVIARANALPFGLAGYVFSNDAMLAQSTAERLETGMVGINEMLIATAEAPFGGMKESGFGREGGALGILDYLEPKYIRHKLIAQAS
jgi:succinate-semialdehyde dehydrogenase/glutarate-semialdehyde dehydrogenase